MRLTSVQTLVFAALFLGDRLRSSQWLAFGILVLSSVLLGVKPARSGVTISRAALRIVPATTLLALNGVLMAHVFRATSVWSGLVWEHLGMIIAVAVIGCILSRRGCPKWHAIDRRTCAVLIIQQATRLVTGLAPAAAIAHGVPVAVLSALNGIQPAWVWILAIVFLGERVQRTDLFLKGSGILSMALGIYWLV